MVSSLNLIIYHSPLFAAHWALFLPTDSEEKIGKRVHADGSPASGFEVLLEPGYDLKDCTQSYQVIKLGDVVGKDFEHIARSVEPPGKSLVSASSMGARRRIEMKNCQTWIRNVVERLVEEGVLGAEAMGVIEGAPRN